MAVWQVSLRHCNFTFESYQNQKQEEWGGAREGERETESERNELQQYCTESCAGQIQMGEVCGRQRVETNKTRKQSVEFAIVVKPKLNKFIWKCCAYEIL